MATPFITDAQATQKIQESYDQIGGQLQGIVSGFQGTIEIADTPTNEGYYKPIEEGTYTNAGGLTYLPSTTDEGFDVTFIFSGSVWSKSRVLVGSQQGLMKESEYVKIFIGKNLFDSTKIKGNTYVESSNGNIGSALGYGCSDYVPIESLETYTLSGVKGQRGLSFFENYGDVYAIPGSVNVSTDLPITFTAPANANFVVFNIYSPSEQIYSNLQVEKGSAATKYHNIDQKVIKPEALPDSSSDVRIEKSYVVLDSSSPSASYVVVELGDKVIKSEVRCFPTGTMPIDITKNSVNDVTVKASSDDTAPYRMQGIAIGGNHNGGDDNHGITRSFFIDGQPVSEELEKLYFKDNFTICEKYKLNYQSIDIAMVSYSFVFDPLGNCVIYTDILGLTDGIVLKDMLLVMATKLLPQHSLYVPKTLPFTFEGVSYDFSSPYDMTGFSTVGRIQFDSTNTEPTGILADRVISISQGFNYQIGYIPVQAAGIAQRRINAATKAIQISNSEKIYPSCIDSTLITTFNKDDYYSAICYKGFSVPKGQSTSSYTIPTNQGIYVYLDWHATGITDRIEMETMTIGKSYEVIEKSSTIEVLNSENTGTMTFRVNSDGYVILKFS